MDNDLDAGFVCGLNVETFVYIYIYIHTQGYDVCERIV